MTILPFIDEIADGFITFIIIPIKQTFIFTCLWPLFISLACLGYPQCFGKEGKSPYNA